MSFAFDINMLPAFAGGALLALVLCWRADRSYARGLSDALGMAVIDYKRVGRCKVCGSEAARGLR